VREREDGTKLNFFFFFSLIKNMTFCWKRWRGLSGSACMHFFFLTTLSNHSFILYCWLSEKKQDCRNAEMKKKILIITQTLTKRENKEQISFFPFFKDNSHFLFFLHFVYIYVLIAASSSCVHFFRSCILFLVWKSNETEQMPMCKKRERERQPTLASLHLKITSKYM
jgi:hypothetical protein